MSFSIFICLAKDTIQITLDNPTLYELLTTSYITTDRDNDANISGHIAITTSQGKIHINTSDVTIIVDQGIHLDYLNFIIKVTCQLMLLKENVLLLHASSFLFSEKAYLFSGVSGSGKTTLIRNIKKENVQILSEDTCILTMHDEYLKAWTSPFDYKREFKTDQVSGTIEKIWIHEKANINAEVDIELQQIISNLLINNMLYMFLYQTNTISQEIVSSTTIQTIFHCELSTVKTDLLAKITQIAIKTTHKKLLFTKNFDISTIL